MTQAPTTPLETILFDCDSTLSAIEGIDEIGPDHRERIEALTDRAMSGELPLEAIYGERLRIVSPTFADVHRVAELYVERLTPGARRCVQVLTKLGKRVGILSGGVRQAVARVARELAIPGERVFAVELFFDAAGRYVGFDERSQLSRRLGKLEVIRGLAGSGHATALVGDGMTDLECEPILARFVGFGGVKRRPPIERAASYYVRVNDLRATLPFLLTETEREQVLADPDLAQHVGDFLAS